ncbi:hypothetical protein GE09DRAFT_1180128 [Coniochaeta sp. 2T2.1]|nr:hypothetical protein GE09DRAFT_1180128 [Coniochaeta sp. 2T2.1]
MNYASMIEEKRLKQGFIIATLISTIVGTFTTGINLFDRISDKRRQHKTDHGQDQKIRELERRVNEAESRRRPSRSRSPSRRRGDDDLRGSLEYGGPIVRREYDRGYADIGPRFAEGDLIAQTQLQSQIITLQGTVIKLLEEALVTGRPPDVQTLLNASEFAREGSVKALRDQYQRLLQSAPIQRPMGLVRRISSTPTLRDSSTASSATADWTDRSRLQKAIAFNKPGPLFCPYAEDLQRTSRPLDRAFVGRCSCGPCPACGAIITSEGEGRRSWNIIKEVVRERRSCGPAEGAEVVEIIQDRTYLLTDRFIVKCHREGVGFACYLCFQHRDRDALCKGVQSLVTHVLEKHDIAEYETDPDIRDVTSAYR